MRQITRRSLDVQSETRCRKQSDPLCLMSTPHLSSTRKSSKIAAATPPALSQSAPDTSPESAPDRWSAAPCTAPENPCPAIPFPAPARTAAPAISSPLPSQKEVGAVRAKAASIRGQLLKSLLVLDRKRRLLKHLCFSYPPLLNQPLKHLERETRIELATNSLEGCDSTTELLPLKTATSF
jgi:hypothetical protein